MKRQLSFVVLLLAALMVPPLFGAADAPSPPAIVAGFLGLSEDQATRFGQLLQELQGAVGSIEQGMQAQQQQLERLAATESPDPAAVGQAFLQLRALARQGGQAIENYHQQFAAFLTAEQKEKVQAVNQAAQLQAVVPAFVALRLVALPAQ